MTGYANKSTYEYKGPTVAAVGKKADATKARLDLLPPKALMAVGHVLKFGAAKYGAHNWRNVKKGQERYVAAALRHIMADMDGARYDEESQHHVLAHAIASLMFALEFDLTAPEELHELASTHIQDGE